MIGSSGKEQFEPLADSLEAFRAKYGLDLVKYWRDEPSWRFRFQHPNGGTGCVELTIESSNLVEVASYWWKDDYEEGRRISKREVSRLHSVEGAVAEIESRLLELLKWEEESLTVIREGFKDMWQGRYSKVQFEGFTSRLPQLTVHEQNPNLNASDS